MKRPARRKRLTHTSSAWPGKRPWRFRPIGVDEAERYWASGEPQDKAGGYAIQGWGAVFVSSLEGSYSAVVGLPLCETAQLLEAYGLRYWCKSSV